MTGEDLKKIIKEEIQRILAPASPAPAPSAPAPAPAPNKRRTHAAAARWLQDATRAEAQEPHHQLKASGAAAAPEPEHAPHFIESPADPRLLRRVIKATPSRIAVGRAGVRYLTEVYLGIRADHAIAKDAVYSENAPELAQKLGCIPLKSRCKDKQQYLLYPGEGRRLDEESERRLLAEGTRGADIQLIVGDGLSAWAAERNCPELLPLMQKELTGAGWSVGRPLYARFARVGLQDHVGTLLNAKATVIMLGERPGLGTGDSLSIYIAYGPKLDQDNAEKNCISNVRSLGILPPEGARLTADILKRAFATGRGGVSR